MNNLKKTALGLMVAIIALGFSAFKSEQKTGYTFYYNGPNLSVSEVEKESNWVYDEDDNECSAINHQACSIRINDVNLVDLSGDDPILKTEANLSATLNPSYSTAYVTGSADDTMQKFNEAHP
ncbi:MAG: hypothetical protein EOP54_11765 [Sphingobacteriales bacterium]|nr:MAG: hypothetical protein EOP54_11765 [Sphingobacteriales bacterium]